MFWGISESLDLYQEYLNALKDNKDPGAPKNNDKIPENKKNKNDNQEEGNERGKDIEQEKQNEWKAENEREKENEQLKEKENVPEETESKIIINEIENKGNEQKKENEQERENGREGESESEREKENENESKVKINKIENKANEMMENENNQYSKNASAEENENKNIENDGERKYKSPDRQTANEEKDNINVADDDTATNEPNSLNILIFGAGDPRHVIKTIAKLYKHRHMNEGTAAPTLNFYILEGCVEITARNIALLGIVFENPEKFSLRNKVHLFMDIYGNALVRPASHHYLVSKAKTLLKMVTDDMQLEQMAPLLNIEGLKYRERDGLENAFNFWLPKESHVFDMPEYWVARLRKLLGTRYDYRDGAFDWDLNMTLKYRDAQQICSQEYRYWRETGIAFTYPEYEQCKPNKTLSAGLVRNGERYIHRGYVGDIEIGPFCTFGLRTRDERLSKSAHGENDYRSTDVTERNLLELFHEIQTREKYEHNTEISRRYGGVKLQMGNRFTWNECDIDVMQEYDQPWLRVEGVKINFLSADEVFTLQDANGRWRDFFDVAFVGHNYFAFIKSTFAEVLRANGLLLMETKLLTLARKEAVTEFEEKLKNFAKTANLASVLNYNAINANFTVMKFRKQIKNE